MLKYILFPVLALAAFSVPAMQSVHAQEEATAQPALSADEEMKAAQAKTDRLIVLLESLESKEDAAAVAPYVKKAWEELEQIVARLESQLSDEELSELRKAYPDLEESEMQLSRILAELDYRHSWFGCKELRDIFMAEEETGTAETTEEAPLTPELKQIYGNAAESILTAITQTHKILQTVHDKASADAAAPQVAGILSQAKKIVEEVESRGDYSAAVDRYLESRFSHAVDIIMDFKTLVEDIEDNEYYGSEELQQALDVLGQ